LQIDPASVLIPMPGKDFGRLGFRLTSKTAGALALNLVSVIGKAMIVACLRRR
jgi:hypothetical protein